MNEKISSLILATLLAFGLMIGMGNFIGSGADSYNVQTDSNFVGYGKSQSKAMNQTASKLKKDVKLVKEGNVIEKFAGAIGVAVYSVGTLFTAAGYPITLASDMASQQMLGGIVPSWALTIVITALLFVGIFSLMNFIRGTKEV